MCAVLNKLFIVEYKHIHILTYLCTVISWQFSHVINALGCTGVGFLIIHRSLFL